jgi:hypothetical protein
VSDEHPTGIRIVGKQPPIAVWTVVNLSGPNGHATFYSNAPFSRDIEPKGGTRNARLIYRLGAIALTRTRQWNVGGSELRVLCDLQYFDAISSSSAASLRRLKCSRNCNVMENPRFLLAGECIPLRAGERVRI